MGWEGQARGPPNPRRRKDEYKDGGYLVSEWPQPRDHNTADVCWVASGATYDYVAATTRGDAKILMVHEVGVTTQPRVVYVFAVQLVQNGVGVKLGIVR
jgi:hypothetical protein